MDAREGDLPDWLVTATAACALLVCVAGILRPASALPERRMAETEPARETTWVRLAPPAGPAAVTADTPAHSAPPVPLPSQHALPALGEPETLPALPSLPPARAAAAASSAGAATAQAVAGTSGGEGPIRLDRGQLAGSQPWPEYPAGALRRGESGTVTVRLRVTATGDVSEARVDTSSGWRSLDEAATGTIRRRWTFPPGPPRDYLVDIRFQIL
jgi:protein TonB